MDSLWTAWPYLSEEWGTQLEAARQDMAGLCRALSGVVTVKLLVRREDSARARVLVGDSVVCVHETYGDTWLRDTGPLFLQDATGARRTLGFGFNGWGGKYLFDGDLGLAQRVARAEGTRFTQESLILEGGAVEVDGEGTAIVTEQCLLNPNRNPGVDRSAWVGFFRRWMGVEKIIWLKNGLHFDHTDGHVDNVARFVAPGLVVCSEPGGDRHNRDVHAEVMRGLRGARDARGRRLEVVGVPAPSGVSSTFDHSPMPANYLNFVIANGTVCVPTFGVREDAKALDVLQKAMPGRKVVGLPARGLLHGGGAFHCVTQPVFSRDQQP